jgi:hypothetical protein
VRGALAAIGLLATLTAQRPAELAARSASGAVAVDQALRDVTADALVLLVASHPDDRYVLPAVWIRRATGARIGVLLASRGGGAQNSAGSETGDDLERIRTREAEAGCAQFDADVWYLDRPDGGFRRSAAETFAEWGRESTLREFARALRRIRPDAVLTTHHAEEQHGHDLAVVELLPLAVALAADATFVTPEPPHRVEALCFGAGSTPSSRSWALDADRLDPVLGVTLRRHAYEILRDAHRSPGPPAPIDGVFDRVMWFEPSPTTTWCPVAGAPDSAALPSLFDGRWPGDAARGRVLAAALEGLAARWRSAQLAPAEVAQLLAELRAQRAQTNDDARTRLDRRIAALERLLLLVAGVQVEVEVPPGTIAVAGEEFVVLVHIHRAVDQPVTWSVAGLHGVVATLQDEGDDGAAGATTEGRASVVVRVPRDPTSQGDPMAPRFRGPRFEPPVQLRVDVQLAGTEVPVTMRLPIDQRAPVDMHVVPRMLLLPSRRQNLQFSVGVTRNSRFPIEGELEVRGAAGYAFAQDRAKVALHGQRSDTFGFSFEAPRDRKRGVDVLRIRMGANRVELPIHKVDVDTPPGLRVGLVRSRDDTLPGVLGTGGLGVDWSDLSDADVAVADLARFDTVVVDIRALRDRPSVRSTFRRLLEFARAPGHRLVVLYHKDVEFDPPGEGFVGAPHLPFQVGNKRVTRADAPVQLLLPEHVLLRHPNVIQPSDWDGWEQERALYLPSVWASQYEELLEVHDPGQPAERGALLYARTEGGEYVYCALSLWRQLKKLHPGAVRLMANLLSPAPRG